MYTLTDNRNRTVAEVRHVFSKAGGNLGTDGSVSYLFSKQGRILLPDSIDEDHVVEIELEASAEDVVTNDDGTIEVTTSPESFLSVKEALLAAGLPIEDSEVAMVPSITVSLDLEGAEKILKLIDALEDLDDVQNVYTNSDISDEVIALLEE